MENERFVETRRSSFFVDYLDDQIVTEDHFFPSFASINHYFC